MWLTLALLAVAAAPDTSPAPSNSIAPAASAHQAQPSPSPAQHKTINFDVRSESARLKAYEVAERCESLRATLQQQWLATEPHLNWTPICQVVLHASRSRYLAAVGMDAKNTTGCTSLKVEQGRVTLRRVDVCCEDIEKALSALSHELTHVVLTDRFRETTLPRWADEGIATLADRMEKQQGHHRDLITAWTRGGVFRISQLLATEDYPAPQRMAAFYGQSTSLVRFLIHRKSPRDFINFMEKAKTSGYEVALREIYEIQSVAELDQLWFQYAATEAAHPTSRANIALVNMDVLVTLASNRLR